MGLLGILSSHGSWVAIGIRSLDVPAFRQIPIGDTLLSLPSYWIPLTKQRFAMESFLWHPHFGVLASEISRVPSSPNCQYVQKTLGLRQSFWFWYSIPGSRYASIYAYYDSPSLWVKLIHCRVYRGN